MESLRIVCFGDSLTAGYSRFGMMFTPYAQKLKSWLEAACPATKLTLDVNGLSGDRVVSGSFLPRITAKCGDAKAPYDWIIILGGTNDLGYGFEADRVFAGLEKVYQVAFDHGANILALTVPECHAVSPELDANRDKLNTLIKGYKAERFYTLDLYSLMPYHTMSKESRDVIWDDGLHFTPDGYGIMGDHIANRLVELIWATTREGKSEGENKKAEDLTKDVLK